MEVEPTSWTDGRLKAGPSSISGRGLIAQQPIAAGDTLIVYGGAIVTTEQLEVELRRASENGGYVDTLALGLDQHLVPDADAIARFGNHSCDPNAWLSDATTLVARRAIRAGEEVTCDYATFSTLPSFSMRCECATPPCRGSVTGLDWQSAELQARYRTHWSPAVQRLIDTAT